MDQVFFRSGLLRLKRKHAILFFALSCTVTMACVPLIAYKFSTQVEFNQHLVESAWSKNDVNQVASFGKRIRSRYGYGVRAIFNGFHLPPPDVADHGAVLEFLLSNAPSYAIVYPTENFYYFRFQDNQGQWVWGNLRLADANAGNLGLTYFHPGSDSYEHKIFINGKDIRVENTGEREYTVEYRGKSTIFFIPPIVTQSPDGVSLLENEKYVGRIIDESAIRFHLLFNTSTNSFYLTLDESDGVPDIAHQASAEIQVMERSGFAFYCDTDHDRKLLVGVPLRDIAENNYFDGPGDQVPFEIEIRDLLYLAYPHTMLERGLDEHGVFLGKKEWQRVAITPYVRYAHIDEVADIVQRGLRYENSSERCTVMTTEWWNTPSWQAMQIRRLHEDGKALVGKPTGLLSIDQLIEKFPEQLSFLTTETSPQIDAEP